MSRMERRQQYRHKAEQFLRRSRTDPDAHGEFMVAFVLRLMAVYTGFAVTLIAVIIAIINAIARRRHGPRYVLTSKPTLTAAILSAGSYLAGIVFQRWTRAQVERRAGTDGDDSPQ